jgi:hypothetical protein
MSQAFSDVAHLYEGVIIGEAVEHIAAHGEGICQITCSRYDTTFGARRTRASRHSPITS